MYPTNRNTVLGAGYVRFARKVAGVHEGYLYLANTESLEIGSTPSGRVTDYDADGEIATINLDIDTQVERTLSFVTKHISHEAIRLFFGAPGAVINGTAAAYTDQEVNAGVAVIAQRWYTLGDAEFVVGAKYVSDVEVRTVETTPVILTEGEDEDYILDATNGLIYINLGSAAVGKILEADFTVAGSAGSVMKVSSPLHQRVQGKLLFTSANTVGLERGWLIPEVILSPSGPFALKSREQVQRLGFNGRIQQPEDGSPAIIEWHGGRFA